MLKLSLSNTVCLSYFMHMVGRSFFWKLIGRLNLMIHNHLLRSASVGHIRWGMPAYSCEPLGMGSQHWAESHNLRAVLASSFVAAFHSPSQTIQRSSDLYLSGWCCCQASWCSHGSSLGCWQSLLRYVAGQRATSRRALCSPSYALQILLRQPALNRAANCPISGHGSWRVAGRRPPGSPKGRPHAHYSWLLGSCYFELIGW